MYVEVEDFKEVYGALKDLVEVQDVVAIEVDAVVEVWLNIKVDIFKRN